MAATSEEDLHARLSAHGVVLSPNPPPTPIASYIPCVQTGSLLYVSGQIPRKDGKVLYVGQVGGDVSIEEAQEAAKLCVANALQIAYSHLGSLSRIQKVVRVGGFVRSASDFTEQPKVINGASNFLLEIFGDKIGSHSRAAVGVSSLPLGVAVEVEFLFEVKE